MKPSFPSMSVGAAGGVTATVFPPKPPGREPGLGFYRSSRFDWLSQVGSIEVRRPEGSKGSVTLCGATQPPPHQPPSQQHAKPFFLDRRMIMHVARSGGTGVVLPREPEKGRSVARGSVAR